LQTPDIKTKYFQKKKKKKRKKKKWKE
jgi:hypothetical protein